MADLVHPRTVHSEGSTGWRTGLSTLCSGLTGPSTLKTYISGRISMIPDRPIQRKALKSLSVSCDKVYSFCQDVSSTVELWKVLKEMGIPDHLTCLLRNLYAGQEATVKTGHGTIDWFQIGKGVCQGCILSPCLFNFYAEYIMRNAGLEAAQAGIKIAGRNINNLRYKDIYIYLTPPCVLWDLTPLTRHREHRVLTTAPPGKSPDPSIY